MCRSVGVHRVVGRYFEFYVICRILLFNGFQLSLSHICNLYGIGITLFLNGMSDGILTVDTVDQFLFGNPVFHFGHIHHFHLASVGSGGNHGIAEFVQAGVFCSQTHRIHLFRVFNISCGNFHIGGLYGRQYLQSRQFIRFQFLSIHVHPDLSFFTPGEFYRTYAGKFCQAWLNTVFHQFVELGGRHG